MIIDAYKTEQDGTISEDPSATPGWLRIIGASQISYVKAGALVATQISVSSDLDFADLTEFNTWLEAQ